MHREAVEHPRSVRVNKSAQKLLRIPIDKVLLPWAQANWAFVLSSAAVLRKGNRPGRTCGDKADGFALWRLSQGCSRACVRDAFNCPCALGDDLRVAWIERHFEHRRSRLCVEQVAVSQVDTEQIAVTGRLRWSPVRWKRGDRVRSAPGTPSLYRAPARPRLSSCLIVACSVGDEVQGKVYELIRDGSWHEHTFAK